MILRVLELHCVGDNCLGHVSGAVTHANPVYVLEQANFKKCLVCKTTSANVKCFLETWMAMFALLNFLNK